MKCSYCQTEFNTGLVYFVPGLIYHCCSIECLANCNLMYDCMEVEDYIKEHFV